MCPLSRVDRFPLLTGFQCTKFNGRAIGTGNIMSATYIEGEGPLIEVPLYKASNIAEYSPVYSFEIIQ